MPRHGYPPEFRRRVLDLVASGRKVADSARDLGISAQSIYTWRKHDEIDRRLRPGATSHENAELQAARRRITELERELTIHRRAAELLKDRTDPKGEPGQSR